LARRNHRYERDVGSKALAFSLAQHGAIAGCLFAGLLLFYGYYYSIHQDLAGSALSGRLAVDLGGSFRSYSSYFPPAEKIWFSLAVRLSDLSGARLDLVVVAMSGALVLVGTGLAFLIRRATVGASLIFMLIPVLLFTILPILFKNVFGLREHIIALGLWPYLVLRVSDPEGKLVGWQVRLLLGVWIGTTLLFKYLYSIVIILVELADALLQRRPFLLFRVENVVAGAIVALYLFTWLVLDPSQREVIVAVISAIDANLADPMANWLQAISQLSFALVFLLAARIFHLPHRATVLGVALVVGAVIAAWTQERWYSHHLFPITMAYAAWWWMVGHGLRWWCHAVIGLYLLVPIVKEYRATAAYQQSVDELGAAMEKAGHSLIGQRVGILTMHPSPYNQYLAAKGAARWNASMNNAYVAAELKSFDLPENAKTPPPPVKLLDPGRRMLHDEMLRLWEDMPPDALILDHSTRWPLRHTDVQWTHVFSKDPRFNAILARYRPVLAHKGDRLEFKYYVRAN
jgi:hypothetical protein